MTSIHHFRGDGNFDYLVEIVSARIVYYKVAIFPFTMGKDLVGRCQYPVHPLVLISIEDSCLNQLSLLWLPMVELML